MSIDGTRGNTPFKRDAAGVTFRPKQPHNAAGTRTEPPVSVPMAMGVMPGRHRGPGSS